MFVLLSRVLLFSCLMDIAEDHGYPAEKHAKYKESDAGHDDDSSHTCAERIDQDDDGQSKKHYSTEHGPSGTLDPERIKVAAEGDDHECMVHHPDAEKDRKNDHCNSRIHAQQEA